MDPLTHTLLGATAASTRTARDTPLAAFALIVGANLPDVDAFLYFVNPDRALAFRRGWTHGLLAMALWPLLLVGLLWLWRAVRPGERATEGGALRLFAFCCVGVWSHPCLDWLNTYGLRWMMPLDGTWFYGDSVFIVDPWLWLILGLGVLLPRRARKLPLIAALLLAGLLTLWVSGRAPRFVPLVLAICALALIGWLIPLPERARRRAALAALVIASTYVGSRIALHGATVERVESALAERSIGPIEGLMVGPMAGRLLAWDVLAATPTEYRFGRFEWAGEGLRLEEQSIPRPNPAGPAGSDEAIAWRIARNDPAVAGFVGWARFPWYEIERMPEGFRVHLLDARYARNPTSGFGGAVVDVPYEVLESAGTAGTARGR
jgi:inner membrane protein